MNNPLRARRLAQAGITLVEMMVALVIGLILMAGIIQLFASNKQAYRIQEGSNVVNENARFAVSQMHYDLRMAAHWGGVEESDLDQLAGSDAIVNDCGGSAKSIDTVGVRGFEGANASPIACLPATDYQPDTDVLVLRYAKPQRVASGSIVATDMYVRSAIGRRGIIFQGKNKSSLPGDLIPADLTKTDIFAESPEAATYKLETVIYFIRRCSSQENGNTAICDGADDTIPSLARIRLRGTTMVKEDVISGVEQLQLAYGVDTNGDRSADLYERATDVTANNDWGKVVNVKMSMVLRNTQRDTTRDVSDTANTYYLYGGANGGQVTYVVPAVDRPFPRKVYNSSVQIRNMTRG